MNSSSLASIVRLSSTFFFFRHMIHFETAFLGSLLKDIKSERPKITEKDNLRLLFVTKWFLEFFLAALAKDSGGSTGWNWGYDLVTEVVDRAWIVWILRRMRGAIDEKVRRYFPDVPVGNYFYGLLAQAVDRTSSRD